MKSKKFWPYHPRYWIYWLLLGLLWLFSLLPYRVLLKLGAGLGWLIMRLAKRPYRNAEINLRLCYPELNDKQRDALLQDNFRSVGIGIFELLLSWWASDKRLAKLMDIKGTEHIDAALALGKGVIIAAPHFTSLELALRMLSTRYPVAVMYNRQKHAWFEYFNQKALTKYYAKAIPRENVRAMIKALNQNRIICYTPDIDPGRKNGIFVPFFDIPAATVTGTTRFAQMTGAQVLFAVFYRREEGSGYDLAVKPLEQFPSGNVIQDVTTINQLLEAAIRHKPEQYIWQYKRFKTRPEGERCFYE
ncbi:MAG: lipid biosynthesis lauroyl acyltransferase [Gammaproteobacteria bacterium]|jgi:KDO2-lipid IV(A) lauroyltransferase|nr:lipid biosynthesis lauroyl acyltransferase [Gammaproteobacteria bacterium]